MMNLEEDDFANDKEIQKIRKAKADYEAMLKQCEKLIAEKLMLESASHRNMLEQKRLRIYSSASIVVNPMLTVLAFS